MDASVSQPRAADLLAVRSRVGRSAIAAGAMIATAVYFVMTLLGALGLEVVTRGDRGPGAGAASPSRTLLVAMFFGGWATSRLAVGEGSWRPSSMASSSGDALPRPRLVVQRRDPDRLRRWSACLQGLFPDDPRTTRPARRLHRHRQEPPPPVQHGTGRREVRCGPPEKAGMSEEQAKKARPRSRGLSIGSATTRPASLTASARRRRPPRGSPEGHAGEATRRARQATWWTSWASSPPWRWSSPAPWWSQVNCSTVPILGVRGPAHAGHPQ